MLHSACSLPEPLSRLASGPSFLKSSAGMTNNNRSCALQYHEGHSGNGCESALPNALVALPFPEGCASEMSAERTPQRTHLFHVLTRPIRMNPWPRPFLRRQRFMSEQPSTPPECAFERCPPCHCCVRANRRTYHRLPSLAVPKEQFIARILASIGAARRGGGDSEGAELGVKPRGRAQSATERVEGRRKRPGLLAPPLDHSPRRVLEAVLTICPPPVSLKCS